MTNNIKIIEDLGITEGHSNGSRNQTVLFSIAENNYKIIIHDESYDFQSYAKLYKWTDKEGFQLVINKNPKKHYNVAHSYEDVGSFNYNEIIDNLYSIAKQF